MSRDRIFISYRRSDSSFFASRISDYLEESFPRQVVDYLNPFSTTFVAQCQVVLAIIGPKWLQAKDGHGQRRIEQFSDHVRQEIGSAIQKRIPVLPILVDGAKMPTEESLPEDIRILSRINAIRVSEKHFTLDMHNLVTTLESLFETSTLDEKSRDAESTAQARGDELFDEAGLVFVCYAREDQDFALRLAKTVKERGVRVWVDQWDIPASADWDHSIDEALFSCDRFLIVLSQSAVGSNEVRTELRTAIDEKKCIVPVLLQQCRIPRALRLTQHIDFISAAPDDEKRIGQLLRALKLPK
jgi:hypothetical protein